MAFYDSNLCAQQKEKKIVLSVFTGGYNKTSALFQIDSNEEENFSFFLRWRMGKTTQEMRDGLTEKKK
jgi:hypothetical protein